MKIHASLLAVVIVMASCGISLAEGTNVSPSELQRAIDQNLVYHAPQFAVLLDEASADPGLDDLERAGLAIRLGTTNGCRGPRSTVVLTEKGQALAARRGWGTSEDVLMIPLGSFDYVPGSSKVVRNAKGSYAVRFRYRYTTSSNAAVLLSLGRAKDWDSGDGFTLADAGTIHERTAMLLYNPNRGWFLEDEWERPATVEC